ncbi:MAG: hypothetical protein ACI350_02240 [Prevotella sp.]
MKIRIILFSLTIALALEASARPDVYKWQRKGNARVLRCGDAVVGRAELQTDKRIGQDVKIVRIDDATFRLTYRLTARSDVKEAQARLVFIHEEKAQWWAIPAISYNGNHWGRGDEPKDAMENGVPRTFSYRRTPIPGAVYSEGDRFAVATWSTAPQQEQDGFSCGLATADSSAAHLVVWPEEERPRSYVAKDTYGEGFVRTVELKEGDCQVLTLFVHVSPVLPHHQAQASFLKTAWTLAPKPQVKVATPRQLWDWGVTYAKESLWAEEKGFKGFSIGLVRDNDRWIQRPGWKYEIGWCGQNASLANTLFMDYLLYGHEDSRDKAVTTLDTWCRDCVLPNGLMVTNYDYILDGQTNGVVDACNLGTAAVNLLEADSLARRCGLERPQYRKAALGILDFMVRDQQDNGCYGKGWNMSGACVHREGTIGAFIIPPMVDAYRLTKDRKYLKSAIRAHRYYMDGLLTDGYTTAGALDTWCIDKESAITLLRSALRLYRLTGDYQYAEEAVAVSCYLSTWLWHYDAFYPADDMMTIHGYHTFGATSVSVQHHHLDPYALFWVVEWMELSRITGDRQWREKAQAVWRNGCQLVSDGTLVIDGIRRPVGSQNEAYFECNWSFSKAGRINSWLVAWPGAFRLETLRRMQNRLELLQ